MPTHVENWGKVVIVSGRVCPQENQCEAACIIGNRFLPVAIGNLERYVSDYEREEGKFQVPEMQEIAKTAIIIGGGNTAMDSVRTAKRLGADKSIIVYRRSMEEMPARVEEVHHAQEEGVEFHLF